MLTSSKEEKRKEKKEKKLKCQERERGRRDLNDHEEKTGAEQVHRLRARKPWDVKNDRSRLGKRKKEKSQEREKAIREQGHSGEVLALRFTVTVESPGGEQN